MAYYKQSYDEAQGNAISVETYRQRRDELKKQHGEKVFTIQAKYEKRKRQLQGQIYALNKEMFAEIAKEQESYKAERAELVRFFQQTNQPNA